MSHVIGIDTGGTFTDLIAIDPEGVVRTAKHPSTPHNPVEAIAGVLRKDGLSPAQIERIVHGTTVATNAVIQRAGGANVLYLTTAGFEDIPFIQRLNRKKEYDLHWRKPVPLVKRRNCLGVQERIDHAGQVVEPLTAENLAAAAAAIRSRCADEPVDAIAVCLLFAYVNPDHELLLAGYLRDQFPHLPVSLSHQVAPIWREYERASTTLADAYTKPMMVRYSDNLSRVLREMGAGGPCSVLKSNGGMTLLQNVPDRPAEILLSGLAGGIVGGRFFALQAGLPNAITLDMGGTSADVGVIQRGEQHFTTDFEIEWGLPVSIPLIEVKTLGAGGGSIAWIDKGGMLNVGPQSAGAHPGPACYGTGGEEATVTDANVVLGRLNPNYFLGGDLRLQPQLARSAVQQVADRMGVSLHQAAAAIVDIADENMTNAIRLLTIEKGLDPRDFALVPFGGAGPVHGCAIARKLGVGKVLVPPHPGLTSALGAAISELRVEKVRTFAGTSTLVTEEQVVGRFVDMIDDAVAELGAEGYAGEPQVARTIAMRYFGQNYEQDVEFDPKAGLAHCYEAFHQLHHQFYGYHFADEVIELVHLKVSVKEQADWPSLRFADLQPGALEQEGSRQVYEAADRPVNCPVYRREHLPAGTRLPGPAIVEERDSTTYIPSGTSWLVDAHLNILIDM